MFVTYVICYVIDTNQKAIEIQDQEAKLRGEERLDVMCDQKQRGFVPPTMQQIENEGTHGQPEGILGRFGRPDVGKNVGKSSKDAEASVKTV